MLYEIQCRTRKHPEWQVIVIVPTEGGSRPARYQSKETAKRALAALRVSEDLSKRHKTPANRRTYRLAKVEDDSLEAIDFAAIDRAVAL